VFLLGVFWERNELPVSAAQGEQRFSAAPRFRSLVLLIDRY
jgi:hypothetical protein